MAVNYVKGQILSSNLERDGIDLSISNANVGIGTLTPSSQFEVVGNVTVGNVLISNIGTISTTGNIDISNGNLLVSANSGIISSNASITFDSVGQVVVNPGYVTSTGDLDFYTASFGNYSELWLHDEGNAVISTAGNTHSWVFDTTGILTAPGNIVGNTLSATGSVLVGNVVIPATGNISAGNVNINDVVDPVANQDAATKYYVDQATANVSGNVLGNLIQMGTNTAGAFVSNAVTLTANTTVTNGIAELNYVLGKLVPASPPNFPAGQTLSMTTATTTARMCSGFTQPDNTATGGKTVSPNTVVAATRVATYTTNTITTAGPGDSGTLTAYRNGSAVGNVTFNTAATPSANGTYGGNLVVTNNYDYHTANASITAGFWYVFSSAVSGATAPSGWNEVYIAQSAAGNTNIPSWYYDNSTASAPQFSSTTFAACASPSLTYTSTIPHYNTGTNFNVGFLVNRLSANMYPNSNNLTSATAAGGAFSAPATITYAAANISTPLAQNYLVSSGNATANTTSAITAGFGSSSSGPSVTVTNSYNQTTNTFSPGATVLYKTGNTTAVDEGNVVVTSVGTGSGNAFRIVNPGAGNTPAYTGSEAQFNSQTGPLQTYDAVVVGSTSQGVLKWDATDYSTGYLPAGPNLSTGRSGTQYFTIKFVRTNVSKFDITYAGNVAGMWVALPGSVIDSSSSANGWIDMTVAYAGAGYPGVNSPGNGSNGCSLGGAIVPNVNTASVSKTCTFGTVSSSSTATNEIYIRVALTNGQSVSGLSFNPASN